MDSGRTCGRIVVKIIHVGTHAAQKKFCGTAEGRVIVTRKPVAWMRTLRSAAKNCVAIEYSDPLV